MKLNKIIKEFILRDLDTTYLLESQYVELNELKIDELNSYKYTEVPYTDMPGSNLAWEFTDRCDNDIVVVYLGDINEFKSGYRVKGVSSLVFDPKRLANPMLIKPCPDDKRVNTVYKILITEVIPKYVLTKKPNKLFFNPVSNSRSRLVDMIINKVLIKFPMLKKKNNYLIYI